MCFTLGGFRAAESLPFEREGSSPVGMRSQKKSGSAGILLLGGLIGGYDERSGDISHAEGLVLPSRAAMVSAMVPYIKCPSRATI